MTVFIDREFTEQTVLIDGHSFHNCRFERCNVIYSGGPLPRLVGVGFHECEFAFDGPAANAVDLLRGWLHPRSGLRSIALMILGMAGMDNEIAEEPNPGGEVGAGRAQS